jgi:hypothetical protein
MDTKRRRSNLIGTWLLASMLAGCGGGGYGGSGGMGSYGVQSGPVASTMAFPLQSAYSMLIVNGSSKNFTVTGTCSGTAVETVSTPVAATFEGANALSTTTTLSTSLGNCTSTTTTTLRYFDAGDVPLGHATAGTNYGVFQMPVVVPASVKVADSATLGTETLWADATKSMVTGSEVTSYVVEADTATTAIIDLEFRTYDTSAVLTATEQHRYRIAATGALVPVSQDIQVANGQHLVLTAY